MESEWYRANPEKLTDTFTTFANTSIVEFAECILPKTWRFQGQRFPTGNEGEYITLEPAWAEFGLRRVDPTTWKGQRLHIVMHAGNGKAPYAPIVLDLQTIAPGRIQIEGKCKHSALAAPFGELKASIGQAYPETGLSLAPKKKGGGTTDDLLDECYELITEQGHTEQEAYEHYRSFLPKDVIDFRGEDRVRASFMRSMRNRKQGLVGVPKTGL